ncbi:hypothetical protein [Ligilactobacillus equi]|uniref:Uncharacterized protein n=1 Tax=Ligilactobacillus equi DPC 6820 TaxID=1392007 RepID=V7HUE4_9LACO|nr:hypothetical protein [Ligilactobacillus equi]ETA73532.1 hypothetical protein LEQ_1201 [Ligilactobacillus equi DPC 6820]
MEKEYYVSRAKLYSDEAQRAITYINNGDEQYSHLIYQNLCKSFRLELKVLKDDVPLYRQMLVEFNEQVANHNDILTNLVWIRARARQFE